MTTVRDELAKALRSSLPRWNLEDDRQCREAIARHEREPEDQDAAVVQARANAFEEAAMIAGDWPGDTLTTSKIAAAILARAQEVKP